MTTVISHSTAETQFLETTGIDFAYRRFGRQAELPLVMLQHFRGNLDNWDPALSVICSGGAVWLMVRAGSVTRVLKLKADRRRAACGPRVDRRPCPCSHNR